MSLVKKPYRSPKKDQDCITANSVPSKNRSRYNSVEFVSPANVVINAMENNAVFFFTSEKTYAACWCGRFAYGK